MQQAKNGNGVSRQSKRRKYGVWRNGMAKTIVISGIKRQAASGGKQRSEAMLSLGERWRTKVGMAICSKGEKAAGGHQEKGRRQWQTGMYVISMA